MSAVMLILCLVILAAYACRVDQLSWRQHPLAMSVHWAGGAAAAWAMYQAGQGAFGPLAFFSLAASTAWLIGSYPAYAPDRTEPDPTQWPSHINPLDR